MGFGWLGLYALAGTPAPRNAKRVIFLCMQGAPSQIDTFDYKPLLNRDNGKPGLRAGTQLIGSAVDKPLRGLISDLKSRGLLDDTLVIWGGEFGRTPHAEGSDGRDHNVKAFTIWMAGGGVKDGYTHGTTDDYGYEAVDGKVKIVDWHATILHLLGLDHEKLTYKYAGRDFRLTETSGNVISEIVA